jgi:hypothetical protein
MFGGVSDFQFEDRCVCLGVVLGPSAVGACILKGVSASLDGFGGFTCKGEGGRVCGSVRLNLNM